MEHSIIDTQVIIQWLHTHQHYAGLVAFIISAMESIAVIGTIVPGTVMMTGLGGLVGAGIVPFSTIIIWAIIGAVAGDSISFAIGKRYKQHIRDLKIFKKNPQWLNKSESFVLKHGGKSVFIGRFIGPIRAFVPVVAGMMNLNSTRFLIANISSAIIWAPVYMLPGIFVGAASQALPPQVAIRLFIYLLIALFILWLFARVFKHFFKYLKRAYENQLNKLRYLIQNKPRFQFIAQIIHNPNPVISHDLLPYLACFLITAVIFMWNVIGDPRQGLDYIFNNMFYSFFNSLRLNSTDRLMIGLNLFFGEKIQYVIWAMIFGGFLVIRQWRVAVYFFMLFMMALISCEIVKQLIYVPYPNGLIKVMEGASFPSRSITLLTCLVGFVSFLTSIEVDKVIRRIPFTVAITLIVVLAVAKLYLGIHWVSDVIAGIILGMACVALTILLYFHKPVKPMAVSKIVIPALVVWIGLGAWNVYHNLNDEIKIMQPKIPQVIVSVEQWWQQENNPYLFYRNNRLGLPIEVMNIQCLSDLISLSSILERRGWQEYQSGNLLEKVKALINNKQEAHFKPIAQELYHNQPPALIMSKAMGNGQFLVLKLWNSSIVIEDTHQLIWLGTLDYYELERNKIFAVNYYQHSNTQNALVGSATTEFVKDLSFYHWKQIEFPQAVIEKTQNFDSVHHWLLLIRPR